MTIEKTIEIQGIEPLILFGPYDSLLKKIRNEFSDIQITARGTQITLRGRDEEVALLERIFSEMILLANKHGEVLDTDLNALINLALSPAHTLKTAHHGDEDIIITTTDSTVRAKTDGQRRMVAEAKNNDILFAIGPAGTGKTYTAVAIAVAAWKAKRVKRIVLARPAVEAGESLGFLPGDLAQKIDPYLRPLYDALQEMLT
ncbi:MAG: PhoH family protein, partial [Pelodictyon phaeoclathratiforme]